MKHIFKRILLIAAAVMILQSFSGTYAQGFLEDPKITMKVNVGFDGYYKLGNYTPFHFEIDNKLKDINGELQVELPDEMNNITLYTVQINLPNNATKKFVMNIPINRFTSKLQVNIVEGKNKVFTQSIKMNTGTSSESFGIGILSDDYESVKYVNKIPTSNYGNFVTRTVQLTEETMSESVDALKNFNVILINNYDTSKLSKEKYEALKAWVADGGLLLIGTGPSHNKTLSIFKDDFITGEIGEISELSTYQPYSIVQGTASRESMKLSVLKLDLKDSTFISQEKDTPLIVNIKKGSGNVAVAAFDFGLEPLSSWLGRSSFSEKLLQRLLPDLYANPYLSRDMNMMNNMYAMDNSLRNIPELPKARTTNLMLVLMIYILLVAPISYFVLKKLDKREWMWVTVPVISLLFGFVIYTTGFGTRMNEPIVNIINIVEFGANGNAVPKSYAGVFTPNKSNIKIEAEAGMNIKPLMLNNYDYYSGDPRNSKKEKQVVSKVTTSPNTVVEFYKTSVWSMKTLNLKMNESKTGDFDVKINYTKNAYQGTVTNNSGFDLEECYIATSNQVIDIGPIKDGETLEVKDKKGKYYSYPYEMVNQIYADPYRGRGTGKKLTEEKIDEFRRNMQKRQVMEYQLMSGGQQIRGAKLMGWSRNMVAKDILVNGKSAKRYEKSFVLSDVTLSFRTGNKISYPMGYIQPKIVSSITNGNYDSYSKSFYGRGTVEIHFDIDKSLDISYVKCQYTVNTGSQNPTKQFVWNYKTNAWEEGSYAVYYMDKEKIAKYIGPDNTMKLKFELNDGNLQLPEIAVEGSVK